MSERLGSAGWAALLGVACGPLLGTVWWLAAPEIGFAVARGGAVAVPDADWFGMDGWFLLIGLAVGLATGALAFWRWRAHPVAVLLGMTVGLLLGACVGWWLGGLLGPEPLAAQAAAAVPGDVLDAPLRLRALGVLVAPSLLAAAVYSALTLSSPVSDAPAPVVIGSGPPPPSPLR